MCKKQDFWRHANCNFLDIAVLEWCKLFVEWNGKHHWRKVVPNPADFLSELREGIGVRGHAFEAHSNEMKTYRNKFVAHLDAEREMQVPTLTNAVDFTVYLYDVVRTEYEAYLLDSPANLREFYEERREHGGAFYPDPP